MSDFQLTTDHDIDITNNDFSVIESSDAIRQRLLIRLMTFQGEWVLDTQIGVPYYQTIFTKGVTKDVVDAILKREIAACPGIQSLEKFSSTHDLRTREYSCTFTARDNTGSLIEVTL